MKSNFLHCLIMHAALTKTLAAANKFVASSLIGKDRLKNTVWVTHESSLTSKVTFHFSTIGKFRTLAAFSAFAHYLKLASLL